MKKPITPLETKIARILCQTQWGMCKCVFPKCSEEDGCDARDMATTLKVTRRVIKECQK